MKFFDSSSVVFIVLFIYIILPLKANALNFSDLVTMQNGTCFIQNEHFQKRHAWEKEHIDLPWVLAEKDETAVRIAQPSSFCSENKINLDNCPYYWDRTLPINDSDWKSILENIIVIPCPKKLKNKGVLKILR